MGQGEAFDDVFAGNRDIHGVVEDVAGVFVDDGGDLEPGAVLEVVGLEIDRSHMMRTRRLHRRFSGGGHAALTPPPHRHPEAFFSP